MALQDAESIGRSDFEAPPGKSICGDDARSPSAGEDCLLETRPLELVEPLHGSSSGASCSAPHHHSHHHPHPHYPAVLHHGAHHSSHHSHASLHGGEKCGVLKTLGNIFVSFVGAGVLALPNAFAKSGILLGTLFMVAVAMLSFYCIILLVDCKRALESKGVATYSEVAYACLGIWGKRMVECLLMLSQTGFCVAYLVFIATNLAPLTHLQKVAIISMVVPLQVALAMLKDLAMLAPFSLLADAALIAGMVVVLGDDVLAFRAHQSVVLSKGLPAVPFLFGVVIYCFEGIGMILPLEDSMKDKTQFKATLAGGFSLITLVFVLFGLVGYAAFGEHTIAPITLNLDAGWSTAAVKVSLCIGLFFTFPVMMVPVWEIADRTLDSSTWFEKNVSPTRQAVIRRLGRCCTIVGLGVIASTVCNFGVFISFIGAFACSILAFIIPATCHLVLFHEKASRSIIAGDVALVVFGFVGMFFGVRQYFLTLAEQGSDC